MAEIQPVALERHYTIDEVASLWGFSRQTVRKVFDKEAGVLRYGRGDSARRRAYQSLRIPESVLVRFTVTSGLTTRLGETPSLALFR